MPSVIDIHAHYLAPTVVEQIAAGEFAPHVTAVQADGARCIQFPTHRSRPLFARMTDLHERLAHLDAAGIDAQVLSTWIEMYGYDLPEEAAVAFHTRINEGLAGAVARHPERLRFLASVPLPWGAAAATVLRDAVTRLGAVGGMIGTNVRGADLDDPRFEPLWAAADDLGVPIELHPVDVAGGDRLTRFHFANLLGNPFDTTIAAASLIFGGVFDRYPGLRVVLVHGGGYLPYALGRLAHGYAVRPEARTMARPPREYLRHLYCDTIVFDAAILGALAGLVGPDRLLLGTDYPFDMEPPGTVAMLRDVLGDAASAALSTNARAAFTRLPGDWPGPASG